MDDIARLAMGSCLFASMSESDVRKLIGCISTARRNFICGETIIREGDSTACAGIILKGAVRAEKHLYSGERSIEAYHGAGSLFGDVLMSARNAASPVDVIACEDTEVLFVSIDKIMHSCPESCAAHERLRMNLLNELSEKFWTLRKKLNYLRIKSMRGRIAAYLLELFSQSGAVTVKCLPRDDTAALLGVNRSALSREIGRMRSDGLIDVDGKLVTLLDIEALKRCTMN